MLTSPVSPRFNALSGSGAFIRRSVTRPTAPHFEGWKWKFWQSADKDTVVLRRQQDQARQAGLNEWISNGVAMGYKGDNSIPLAPYTGPLDRGTSLNRWPTYHLAPLDHPIETSGMNACSAFCIIGPDQHYMLHLNPGPWIETLALHWEQNIPWKLTDSRLYLLPGTHPMTRETVSNILESLKRINPSLPEKVQFVHYPEEAAAHSLGVNCQLPEGARNTIMETVSFVSHGGRVYYRPLRLSPGGQSIRPDIEVRDI